MCKNQQSDDRMILSESHALGKIVRNFRGNFVFSLENFPFFSKWANKNGKFQGKKLADIFP